MLSNEKWDERKAPVMSVAGLISWLETQNPKTRYHYTDIFGCLLCRYFKAQGLNIWSVNPVGYRLKSSKCQVRPMPSELNAISNGGEYTYGAALERARAYLA
jgi:hypothetical protein